MGRLLKPSTKHEAINLSRYGKSVGMVASFTLDHIDCTLTLNANKHLPQRLSGSTIVGIENERRNDPRK